MERKKIYIQKDLFAQCDIHIIENKNDGTMHQAKVSCQT